MWTGISLIYALAHSHNSLAVAQLIKLRRVPRENKHQQTAETTFHPFSHPLYLSYNYSLAGNEPGSSAMDILPADNPLHTTC